MANPDETIVTHRHLMTVENFLAEIAKSQAQYAANQAQQTESLNVLTKAVNELVISEKVRAETDKQNNERVDKLIKFAEESKPIINQAAKDQLFWSGFIKNTVYVVSASVIVSILVFSGKLVYDNAGKSNQPQQQQRAGK